MPLVKAVLDRLVLRVLGPLLGWLEERFHGVGHHVDVSEQHVLGRLGNVEEQMTDLVSRVSSDTQTSAEFAATFRRSTDRLQGELHAVWGWLAGGDAHLAGLLARSATGDAEADQELGKLLRELHPGAADRVVGAHEGVQLPIGPGTADFLNWAAGHTGPAAQAGVWFNPPVTVFHHDGTVRAGDVNERIVEIPWAFGAVAALQPGSLVLDIGATESTVALSLASLGFEVLAADLRPYPLQHPGIRSVTGPLEEWEGPERPLDAVTCISAIEHFGIGHYGSDAGTSDLDRVVIGKVREWLRPGGELVLTAPYGQWDVTDVQRVYDAEHLDALLDGFDVVARSVCVQAAHDRWERADGEPPAGTWEGGTRGVVLVRAVPRR
jgi:hypothetical protein